MARKTSVEIYKKIKENGLLTGLRLRVYDVIFQRGPLTQGECWNYYFNDRQRHDICPRFAELKKMGVLIEVGERKCKVTGHKAIAWDVTDKLPVKLPEHKSNKQIIKELKTQLQWAIDTIDKNVKAGGKISEDGLKWFYEAKELLKGLE